MRIVLFRKGRPGVVAHLPSEAQAEQELETALGGEFEMLPIRNGLVLVTLADAEKLQLPFRYMLRRSWAADEPVAGDCAVVAVDDNGEYIDITLDDFARTAEAVLPITGAAS